MQRRAAALYAAFFLVVALGSYGMIAASSAPPAVPDPDVTAPNGSSVSIGGQSYTVLVDETGDRATLRWHDPTAPFTEEWAEGDEVTLDNTTFNVTIPDRSTPRTVELTEVRTLPEGTQTTTVNGTEYVVVEQADGTRVIVPLEDYLDRTQGPAASRSLRAGQAFDYRGNRTTVDTVENDSATVSWAAPGTRELQVSEGDEVDLGGETFVAHFPDGRTLVLDRDLQSYAAQLTVIETYDERINGLWGVSILSGLAVVVLLALSYLPSRY